MEELKKKIRTLLSHYSNVDTYERECKDNTSMPTIDKQKWQSYLGYLGAKKESSANEVRELLVDRFLLLVSKYTESIVEERLEALYKAIGDIFGIDEER